MSKKWTLREMREARDLVESGKTWQQVADILGVNAQTLRHQLNKQGLRPNIASRALPPMKHEDLLRRAVSMRNAQRLGWRHIAVEIDWPLGVPGEESHTKTLHTYCARYAKRCQIKLWSGYAKDRKKRILAK